MSLASPSRRLVLAALPFASVPALAAPTDPPSTDSRSRAQIAAIDRLFDQWAASMTEIDRLFSQWEGAVVDWSRQRVGSAEYEAHHARVNELDTELAALSAEVWSAPVTEWSDVAVRARLAEHWQRRATGTDCPEREEAARRLFEAVRTLAGLAPLPPSQFSIDTIPQLILALDGHDALADRCGITAAAVEQWENRQFIPPGWHHRLACEVSRRGLTLAPGFFQRWG